MRFTISPLRGLYFRPSSQEWEEVVKKKRKKKNLPQKVEARELPKSKPSKNKISKQRSDAVLIRILVEKEHTDVLGEIYQRVKSK